MLSRTNGTMAKQPICHMASLLHPPLASPNFCTSQPCCGRPVPRWDVLPLHAPQVLSSVMSPVFTLSGMYFFASPVHGHKNRDSASILLIDPMLTQLSVTMRVRATSSANSKPKLLSRSAWLRSLLPSKNLDVASL
jgi:hypothetical protein